MTAKNVTNTSEGTVTLPNGPSIPHGRTIRSENWAAVESNTIVQGQVEAGVLLVKDAPNRDDEPRDEFEAELRGMTKAQLTDYIERRGREVAGKPLKDELLQIALALPRDVAAD